MDACIMVLVNMTLHDLHIDVQAWTQQMSRYIDAERLVNRSVTCLDYARSSVGATPIAGGLTWEHRKQLVFVAESIVGFMADYYVNLWACCWTAVQCFQRVFHNWKHVGKETFDIVKKTHNEVWESPSRRREIYLASAFCGLHLVQYGLQTNRFPNIANKTYRKLRRMAKRNADYVVQFIRLSIHTIFAS